MRPLLTSRQGRTDVPLWLLFPLFFVAVYLSHYTLLRLPYFWDEAGYYIPAAWDFFHTGTLIPQTTVTNAHPPLPSILLSAWWHLSGFVVSGTRTLVCMVTAAALLAIYRLARSVAGIPVAIVTVFLTAVYPIWFAQSTLAHADIFAAAFTLWGLAFYLEPAPADTRYNQLFAALFFSLSVLSKETAIVTPVALALWETVLLLQPDNAGDPNPPAEPVGKNHLLWIASLLFPILPLVLWYVYHYRHTGFVFGNPEFLRYNATANLSLYRIGLSLWHRLLHLFTHMNMFVPVVCAIAAYLVPVPPTTTAQPIPRRALKAIAVVLIANWIAFSVLGGALLTRYLLPMFPLILLICVSIWRRHLRRWWVIAALSACAFLTAIWVNPPYAFAPEDNLTYRDMIVLHLRAIHLLEHQYPNATVLSAWPATAELTRPELGYTTTRFKVVPIENFGIDQIQKAATDPGAFDTALIFSTKWAPPSDQLDLGRPNQSADSKYFDFHRDLSPAEVAALLHGEVVWQQRRKGEWAAVLHFPRIVDAKLTR